MKLPRLAIGLRSRLCHLSVAVVASLAAALGCLIDREIAVTIRASSIALLDRAQPAVAARASALLEQGDDAALAQLLDQVVATDPFELAACFDPGGAVRAVATRAPLRTAEAAALREYGVHNALRPLERAWRRAGLRFLQHPLIPARGVLLLATNSDVAELRIAALRRWLWSAAAIGGGIAVIAVLLVARALTQPLLALVDDVRRLERGQPGVRLATSRRDEVGGLARAFGRMAEEVDACRLEQKQRGEQLEEAVAQRKQRLDRALRELKELGQRKDAFLSSISHELRTPLTVMQSSAEILVGEPEPGVLAEFLPGIKEQALALDRIVDNLLCLLDLEGCERVAAPTRAHLGAIVDAALADVEPERKRRDVTLRRELDESLPVRWDVGLTVRLLRELLLNAIRFSPPGGTVRLSARTAGARVHVEVRDEGPGIPEAQCEEVFQRFHQLGDLLTGKPRGTGLGLPICRAIAILHGGWVRAQPRAEPGGCFLLELPADASTARDAEETAASVLAELRP